MLQTWMRAKLPKINETIELQKIFEFAEERNNVAIRLCGKLKDEISKLHAKEKRFFLEEYNLHKSGMDKLIHASYKLLDLEIFFTKK